MNLMEAAYLAIAFVVFVVVTSIGGSVLAGVQSQQTVNSVSYNATGFGLTGILNLAQNSSTIGVVIGAVILIGLLMGAFMNRN